MSDVECPYCKKFQEICHDDGYGYEEEKIYKQWCGGCNKRFAYTTSISYDYEVSKADCLNGGEHKYTWVSPVDWPGWKRCNDCGHEVRGEHIETIIKRQEEAGEMSNEIKTDEIWFLPLGGASKVISCPIGEVITGKEIDATQDALVKALHGCIHHLIEYRVRESICASAFDLDKSKHFKDLDETINKAKQVLALAKRV